jgi:MGT family glycosyltransferase
VRALLPEGAELIALDDRDEDDVVGRTRARSKLVRGLESLQFLWEEVLVPLARAMLPGVRDALTKWSADVVIVDQQAIAGGLAARLEGLRWATLCTTSAGVVDVLSDIPKVDAWVREQVASLEREHGLAVSATNNLSPGLVVVFSTESFVGAAQKWPDHYRFVGPSIDDRQDFTAFPFDELGPRPRVFVSLGTVNAGIGERFYATVVEALRDVDVRVVLAAPPELVTNAPSSFLVRARVPQLALLPQVDAVVCHGGHNTVCEALANGLPLVVAPIRDDQPVVAQQVVASGVGVRVKFGRLSAATLRAAVKQALEDDAMRAAAREIAASFRQAGGAEAAADAIEALAAGTWTP